ncbi:Na+ dependent nucleoside transporter N-terminal domain-containing protein [Paenactinomyces guangxiensis]
MNVIRGLLGIIFLFLIAFLFSNNKKRIRYQTVILGFLLQFLFCLFSLEMAGET